MMKARLAVLLVAGASAAAIAVAPAALAQPAVQPTCVTEGGGVESNGSQVCTTPGNAQITTAPPEDATPYWGGILPFENYGPAIL